MEGTAVPRKVARLHLICDILHNSAAAVPSAWKFRQEFQARLGIVFDHLANIYHSFPGRITADLFKKQITTIVDIWEDWIVFPPDFTLELRKRLEGVVIPIETTITPEPTNELPETKFATKFKSSTFQLAAQAYTQSDGNDGHVSEGEPMDVSSEEEQVTGGEGEAVEDIDIDGLPLDDDNERLTRSRSDSDIDGEQIADDIDGVPVEEDLDGIPIDA